MDCGVQYFKYMHLKYVLETQNAILYFKAFERHQMYVVFK